MKHSDQLVCPSLAHKANGAPRGEQCRTCIEYDCNTSSGSAVLPWCVAVCRVFWVNHTTPRNMGSVGGVRVSSLRLEDSCVTIWYKCSVFVTCPCQAKTSSGLALSGPATNFCC